MEGTRQKSVAVSLVGSSLPTKVGERVEGMLVVEELLVFSVAAFHLAVVTGYVRSVGGGCLQKMLFLPAQRRTGGNSF